MQTLAVLVEAVWGSHRGGQRDRRVECALAVAALQRSLADPRHVEPVICGSLDRGVRGYGAPDGLV